MARVGRIAEAADNRTPVKIRRSSGQIQCIVAWHDDDLGKTEFRRDPGADKVFPVNGSRLKPVDTHDIVGLNPWLLADQ